MGSGGSSASGSGGGGSGGGGAVGNAQFFRADSLWNTPIANEQVAWADQPGLRSGSWYINYQEYANPVVIGTSSDPLVTVAVPASWGWPAGTVQAHVQSGVDGAAGTDGSLVVINGNTVWDFWMFTRDSDTTAHASAWAQNDIVSGSGWGRYSPFQAAGIRAAGSSGLAGEIYGNELTQGIPHALAFATTGLAGLDGAPVPPAISGDGPAEGTRIGIPAGTPKPSGLSVQGSNVWDALQTYGAWLVDQAGGGSPVILNADPRSVPSTDIDALFGDLDAIVPSVRVVVFDYPYDP